MAAASAGVVPKWVVSILGAKQLREYRDTGVLILPGFFTEEEVSSAEGAYDSVWLELPPDVTVDAESTGRRILPGDVTPAEREGSLKVNDLYLHDAALRQAVLSQRLAEILGEFLEDDPVICNTLSVECGTQQADHLDTLYMTPFTPGKLVATWMALEDVESDAGPLRYYPESNHIEPFRFRDGGYHVLDEEADQWADYMAGQVDRHGLAETRFLAKRGDLLIWDAWLLHGGSEITRAGASRRSLITHYYAKTDCATIGAQALPLDSGGYWMKRAPQIPKDSPSIAASSPPEPEVTVATVDAPHVQAGMSLRDRLDLLDPEHH
jgi:phytanoyl-CoA hydroxylase